MDTFVSEPYPYTWKDNAKVVFVPSLVYELWTTGVTPGKNMPGGFIGSGIKIETRDLRVEKMIEFGVNVGMPRLLELLVRENCPSTVLATGRAVEESSDLIREFHARGHEIAGHSYTEDVSSYDFFNDPEAERDNIRRTADAIESVTGERPVGWLSPRGTPSDNTLRLLIEEGYRWCGDFADDELPYVEEIDGKSIAIIPYSGMAVNDYPVTINQGNTPRIYVEEFSETVDILREEYELYGRPGWVRASVHAHVYGRSWGRWAFRDVIRYAKSFPDVWITTRGELGDHVLAQHAAQNNGGGK